MRIATGALGDQHPAIGQDASAQAGPVRWGGLYFELAGRRRERGVFAALPVAIK